MKNFEIVVVGGGHAGVEAALASARLGKKTALINLYDDKIAAMPCNPSVGGPAKGIVVREIDALGGEMGRAADKTAIQMKLLNSSRGPGVWALRAQIDKIEYSKYMRDIVKSQKNLELIAGVVTDISFDKKTNSVTGIIFDDGTKLPCQIVILTTGTYLSSKVLRGSETFEEGPNKEITQKLLSEQLRKIGIKTLRFKTGTPPRVKQGSVDLTKMKLETGTPGKLGFSFLTKNFIDIKDQTPCYLIHSTNETKKIVEDNLNKSAMYSGKVNAIGPRYCPSFEDKIVRFNSKEEHQIFLEPESLQLDTWYVQGFSTSMPIDVQEKMLKSLPGFKNMIIDRWAYAIEYDCIDPTQLRHTLELKNINNLFMAGQINGTSGYEEAAGQGLVAGINAVRKLNKEEPFVMSRYESYIGVMIDDLINKGIFEPYRLLTSRAEYRLLLRNDNAEIRLKKYGHDIGLIGESEWNTFLSFKAGIENAIIKIKNERVTPKMELANELRKLGQSNLEQGVSVYELVKQPMVDIAIVQKYCAALEQLSENQLQNLVINIRFEGYIKKEIETIERQEKLERKIIPNDIDYNEVDSIATEARQKFIQIRPESVAQAARIPGVNPADIQMLLIHLKKKYPNSKR